MEAVSLWQLVREVERNELPPPWRSIKPPVDPVKRGSIRIRESAYFDECYELLGELGDGELTLAIQEQLRGIRNRVDAIAWLVAASDLGRRERD